jgi:hypothetical protein
MQAARPTDTDRTEEERACRWLQHAPQLPDSDRGVLERLYCQPQLRAEHWLPGAVGRAAAAAAAAPVGAPAAVGTVACGGPGI